MQEPTRERERYSKEEEGKLGSAREFARWSNEPTESFRGRFSCARCGLNSGWLTEVPERVESSCAELLPTVVTEVAEEAESEPELDDT